MSEAAEIARLRARVDELTASRSSLVQSGLSERRQVERKLHGGAQQRLISLSLRLALARRRLDEEPAAVGELLDGALSEVREAMRELRELARVLHPAVLAEHGLEPALAALAERSPVPVVVEGPPAERLGGSTELAVYLVVSEALAELAARGASGPLAVSVDRVEGNAVVDVSGDVGGPACADLRGEAARVAALDGRIEVRCLPGGGTCVHATIPVTP